MTGQYAIFNKRPTVSLINQSNPNLHTMWESSTGNRADDSGAVQTKLCGAPSLVSTGETTY